MDRNVRCGKLMSAKLTQLRNAVGAAAKLTRQSWTVMSA